MKEKILNKIKEILGNQNLQGYLKNLAKAFALSFVILISVSLITNVIYQKKDSFKRGYKVEIIKDQKVANVKKTKNINGIAVGSLPDLKGSTKVSIKELIANADIKKGKKTFKKCAACHTVNNGGANKIGPNLFKIVNRKKADVNGFKYSKALLEKGGKWTYRDLNKFLTKPKDFVPGTKMAFAGLRKDKDRANVIAYLESVNQ